MCFVVFHCASCDFPTNQVSDEGFCPACHDYFDYQHAQDQAEYESEREMMPKEAKAFTYNEKTYYASSEMVDTDYGPENSVTIWDADGSVVGREQEAASTDTIIGWWKDNADWNCGPY